MSDQIKTYSFDELQPGMEFWAEQWSWDEQSRELRHYKVHSRTPKQIKVFTQDWKGQWTKMNTIRESDCRVIFKDRASALTYQIQVAKEKYEQLISQSEYRIQQLEEQLAKELRGDA